ncbi:MAG: hypothetical protein FJ304_15545 [Planctomycetes bacterium]|nr:hypothetical protein [Planctomycetota bacterium]
MSATVTNGKPPRKQLADQLDRLDQLIDTLGEGLNGAVADAAREGVRLAVKEVVVELMTNPELRALLAPPAPVPAPTPASKGAWSRIKSAASACAASATDVAERAKAATAKRWASAGEAVAAIGRATGEGLSPKRVAAVGVGVGLAAGAANFFAPQAVAAIVGGATAAVAAVCAQVGAWLARAARRAGLLS